MISSVLTVSQVNTFVKSLIETDGRLNNFFISGEISNFTDHYKSGHLYFSLKDEKSVIKAVMFAGSARRLKFRPKDGMKVIIGGRVSVYEPSGQYQLYTDTMQPDGIGAVNLAFEQLKEKLEAEELFKQEFKKPIPGYPEKIGVITSSTGAAVRDILQITKRRWPVAEIHLSPVLVQGENAPADLINALRQLNDMGECDVVIIGRGGGSYEDLQAFNDESLAREIFKSDIPVISAVGHETDFTIADFVADMRAPTPSAAAELATPDIAEEMPRFLSYNNYFNTEAPKYIEYLNQSVDILMSDILNSVKSNFNEHSKNLKSSADKLKSAAAICVERHKGKYLHTVGKLDNLSPLKILSRGYAVLTAEGGKLIKSTEDVKVSDKISIKMNDGVLNANILSVEVDENG